MPGSPLVWLNDGQRMPRLGLGLWKVDDAEAAAIVREGIKAGYRSFDTAYLYRNEKGVGEGIARSGLDRKELFITTKLWNTRHGFLVIPKTSNPRRMRENLDVFDFHLKPGEMTAIEKLNTGKRIDHDPAVFTGLDIE